MNENKNIGFNGYVKKIKSFLLGDEDAIVESETKDLSDEVEETLPKEKEEAIVTEDVVSVNILDEENIDNENIVKVEIVSVNFPEMFKRAGKYIKNMSAVAKGVWIVIIVFIAIAIGIVKVVEVNDIKKYEETLSDATSEMQSGVTMAEEDINLIQAVWNDAIEKNSNEKTKKYVVNEDASYYSGSRYRDFNQALLLLYADEEFANSIKTIEANQGVVSTYMSSLVNPPEEYADAYDMIKELYEDYISYTEMATNPQGSLASYKQDVTESARAFKSNYRLMRFYNTH